MKFYSIQIFDTIIKMWIELENVALLKSAKDSYKKKKEIFSRSKLRLLEIEKKIIIYPHDNIAV